MPRLWTKLQAAADRIGGDNARTDLAEAIGQREIEVIAVTTTGTELPDNCIGVPLELAAGDLDWEKSCPVNPWPCGRRASDRDPCALRLVMVNTHGLELAFNLPHGSQAQAPRKRPAAKANKQESVRRAVAALGGIEALPEVVAARNRKIREWLNTNGDAPVDDKTIHRALKR